MPSLDEIRHLRRIVEDRCLLPCPPIPSHHRPLQRRNVYRKAKRLLIHLSSKKWRGNRATLQRVLRAFFRPRRRSYLIRILQDQTFSLVVIAVLLAGSISQAATPIDLEIVNTSAGGFVMHGGTAADHISNNSGLSIANAGDVNGDTYDDIIIGAPRSDPNGAGSGSAYVIFGGAGLTIIDLEDVEDDIGGHGFAIPGLAAADAVGFSVSGAGDVDGDGKDDLIIGAPYAGAGGIVYIVFGKTSTTEVNLAQIALGAGGFVINGADTDDAAGFSVSGAGDVNGDTIPDVIVSAPYADTVAETSTGECYIVFGKDDNTTAVDLGDVLNGTGGFAIMGDDSSTLLGFSVSGAGNVNGDAFDDVIVGHHTYNSNAGESFIVFGKSADTNAVDIADLTSGTGGFVIDGIDTNDNSGMSVSHAGDVNGDGLDDVIIGTLYAFANETYLKGGESYVVFGKSADTTAIALTDVAGGQGGFMITGIRAQDLSGSAVSAAGDVNSDGYDDVIVGASDSINSVTLVSTTGESYVVYGKTTGTEVQLSDIARGSGGYVIRGHGTFDFSGLAVSGGGDINGDGIPDIIISAPYAEDALGAVDAGEITVVYGRPTARIVIGVQDAATGEAITGARVYVERTDAPIGTQAYFTDIDASDDAVFRTRPADGVTFNVRADAAGYLPSAQIVVTPNLTGNTIATIDLSEDVPLGNTNTVIVKIDLLPDTPIDFWVLSDGIIIRDSSTLVDTGLIPIYGESEMIFLGVPSGSLEVYVPDGTNLSFSSEVITPGTGETLSVELTAARLSPNQLQFRGLGPRDLPGFIVGAVGNSAEDPVIALELAAVHLDEGDGHTSTVYSDGFGLFSFGSAPVGSVSIQAFSPDGLIAGSSQPVTIESELTYGGVECDGCTYLEVDMEESESLEVDADSDLDGMDDVAFEEIYFGNLDEDGESDSDGDGLSNLAEFEAGTDPTMSDTDGDGYEDAVEIELGSDPLVSDPLVFESTPTQPDPIWVDLGFAGLFNAGSLDYPYALLADALTVADEGGTIMFKGDAETVDGDARGTIDQIVTLDSLNGTIQID